MMARGFGRPPPPFAVSLAGYRLGVSSGYRQAGLSDFRTQALNTWRRNLSFQRCPRWLKSVLLGVFFMLLNKGAVQRC